MRQTFSKLVLTCLMLLIFISISNGQTIVPQGANTLSAAITAATDGDVLVLSGGEYTESDSIIIEKNLTIKAAAGLSKKPVLKTASATFINLKSDLILEGLDFDGQANIATNTGVAIFNDPPDNNNLTITGCIFHDFDGTTGTRAEFNNVGITTIIDMEGTNLGLDSLKIDNCIFRNVDVDGDRGEAIHLSSLNLDFSQAGVKYAELSNSTFSNISKSGIYLGGYLESNEIDTAHFLMDHLTFVNITQQFAARPHNISGSIINCIFAYNDASAILTARASVVNIDYVNFFNNRNDVKITDVSVVNIGDNMYTINPQFTDPANDDYTLGAPLLLIADSDGGVLGDPRWHPNAVGIPQETNSTIPEKFALSQNYPNPFNPVTKIEFDLPESGMVRLNVYNILGENVTLLVNKELNAGRHNYSFDAGNLPSGVYVYKLETKNYNQTRKMILMK